jgi:uncharacterized protein YcbK (DUF882 family)
MPPRGRPPKKYGAEDLKTISSMGTRLDDLQARNKRDTANLNAKIGGTANRLNYDIGRNAIEMRRTGEADQVREVTKSVTKILDKLGLTIAALSKGIVSMTAATATATKQAIQDYGRAISEDIRINKQNFVAMSLSQASPVFGYFVSKLFETQIFRSALEKIKGKAGQLFSGLVAKMRKSKEEYEEPFFEEGEPGIGGGRGGGVVRRAKRAAKRVKTKVGGITAAAKAAGGEGGVSGETIRVIKETTVSSSDAIIEAIKEASKIQVAAMKKSDSLTRKKIVDVYTEMHTLRKGLVEEDEKEGDIFEQLFEMIPILGGVYKLLKTVNKWVTAPLKWLFSVRGGYKGDLPKSGNVFKNIFDVLSLIYTKGMLKLDIISNYLLQIGESLRKVTGAGPMTTVKEEGLTTRWKQIKEWLTEFKKPAEERKKMITLKGVVDWVVEQYDLDRESVDDAISHIPIRWRAKGEETFEKAEKAREKVVDSLAGIFTNTKEQLEAFKEEDKEEDKQEEEKEKKTKKQKLIDKIMDAKERALESLKNKKNLWDIIKTGAMFLFGLFKSILGQIPGFNLLKNIPGMAMRGMKGLGKAGLGIAGGVYGGYEMLKGGMEGVARAGTWHGKKPGEAVSLSEQITAGIGGALGGTGKGVSGALAGAAKGAGIGMALGTVFPGIGNAIGGAVGAIAGGILGAIGGENIAKGLQFVWDGVKKMAGAIVDFITFPIKIAMQLADKAEEWILEQIGKIPVIGPTIVKGIKAAQKFMGGGPIAQLATIAVERIKSGTIGVGGTAAAAKKGAEEEDPYWYLKYGRKPGTYIGGELVEPGKPLSAKQQKLQEISAQMGNAPEGLPGIRLQPGVDIKDLKPGVYDKFTSMAQEYQDKTGQSITVNSGFRSRAEQAQLYATNPYAAAPGHSLHERGNALDVQSFNAGQLDSLGLLDKYGFKRPVPGEPWHLQTEVGDATFRRRPVTTKDVIAMGADREGAFARAFLDSNTDLGKTVGAGLADVSKGAVSNATTISNTIISSTQNAGSGRGSRGGEADSDLAAVISGNLT